AVATRRPAVATRRPAVAVVEHHVVDAGSLQVVTSPSAPPDRHRSPRHRCAPRPAEQPPPRNLPAREVVCATAVELFE
ncbi:hypothetical protein ACWDKQ_35860, partial [Saccharopolyspora sp. NPDC000995]